MKGEPWQQHPSTSFLVRLSRPVRPAVPSRPARPVIPPVPSCPVRRFVSPSGRPIRLVPSHLSVPSRPVPSFRPVSSRPIPSFHHIPSVYHVPSCPVCPTPSRPVHIVCPVSSHIIPSHSVPSHSVPFRPFVPLRPSSPVLFCPVSSCPVRQSASPSVRPFRLSRPGWGKTFFLAKFVVKFLLFGRNF